MEHLDTRTLIDATPVAADMATADYVRLLHPYDAIGKVNFLIADRKDRAESKISEIAAAPFYATCATERTSFVSLNRFHGHREDMRLAALNAVFVDLDADLAPTGLVSDPAAWRARVTEICETAGLPMPSLLNATGRGLAAIRLIQPLPPHVRARWRAAIHGLIALFRRAGADKSCSDTARVFRLPGSVNPKSGRFVRVIGGTLLRYDYDALEDSIYTALGRPTRRQLQERKLRHVKKARRRVTGSGLTPAARFQQILNDLDKLCVLWGGQVRQGRRNTFLHLYATCLTHLREPGDIATAIERMAAVATPGLPATEVRSIVRNAEDRAARPRTANPLDDGRYHYSGAQVAQLLDITDDEARSLSLQQVYSTKERRRRKTERERERRAAAGAMPRAEYLAAYAISREMPWKVQGMSRATWYRRGKPVISEVSTAPSAFFQ